MLLHDISAFCSNRISNLFITGDMDINKTIAMNHISLIIGPRKSLKLMPTMKSMKSIKSGKGFNISGRGFNTSARGFNTSSRGLVNEDPNNDNNRPITGNTDGEASPYRRPDGLLESSKCNPDTQPQTINFYDNYIEGYMPMTAEQLNLQRPTTAEDARDYDYNGDLQEGQQPHTKRNSFLGLRRQGSVLDGIARRTSSFFGSNYDNSVFPEEEEGVDEEDEVELHHFDDDLDIEIGSFLHKSINTRSVVLRTVYRVLHDIDIVYEHGSDLFYHARMFVGKHMFHHAKRVMPGMKSEGVHGKYCFCGCRRIL
jgi:hypothetical protein